MLDPLLRPFIDAADEGEAERELSLLIETHALPLAKAIVGRKLRSYRSDRRERSDLDDRSDVVADAMVTLVERLHAARDGSEAAPIQNFSGYTAAIVYSACAHYIRGRYPARTRLKNRLRYVLSTDPRLALWTSSDDGLVCGLAEWTGAPAGSIAEGTLLRLHGQPRPWATMNRSELSTAVVDAVRAAGAPVDFDVLVAAAASDVVEPEPTSAPPDFVSREPGHDVLLDQRRFLTRVWDEVGKLPLRQRIALLLNLRDVTGAGMLWLLPIVGVATVRQIARVLEMHDAELAGLWPDIPLDDATIGQRLGCTRQQVINLRMAARKRLANRVRLAGAGGRRAQANLTTLSVSLKGSW